MNIHRLAARTVAAVSVLASGAALAHPGHGVPTEAHWHATDTLGLLLVAALAGLALWLGRGK